MSDVWTFIFYKHPHLPQYLEQQHTITVRAGKRKDCCPYNGIAKLVKLVLGGSVTNKAAPSICRPCPGFWDSSILLSVHSLHWILPGKHREYKYLQIYTSKMYLDTYITRCNKQSCKIHRAKLLQLFSQQEKNLTMVA